MSRERERTDRRRLTVLIFSLNFGFWVIVFQLVRYQIIDHAELSKQAEEQRTRESVILPKRGYLADINDLVLAKTEEAAEWEIAVSPPLIRGPQSLAGVLADLLSMSRDQVYSALTADEPWVPVAAHVNRKVAESVAALNAEGITCTPKPLRVYLEGSLFARPLGFVDETGEGSYGVEGYYNTQLKGTVGRELVEQDPTGVLIRVAPLAQSSPRPGAGLGLTLDRHIQQIAQQELQYAITQFRAESGTVIVMDPKTGALLAMVSYPAYDPSNLAGADPALFLDPAISSSWEPGTLFQIITWAAGLDAGVIGPETTFEDKGSLEVGGRIIQNWDRQAHGSITLREGLIKSFNTAAAFISTTMGEERFYAYLRRFGFGSLTNVDLSNEGPGILRLPGDASWFPSDLGTNAFGQGIAVTPIQMIAAVSAVANRGLLMKPYVVRQLIPQDEQNSTGGVSGIGPTVVQRVISEETAESLTRILLEAAEEGSMEARVPGYSIAGKAGTAQIPTGSGYHPSDTIASFVGYAPAYDPEFVVLVKLDRPGTSPWGAETAAPTFRAIAKRLIIYMRIPTDGY